MPKKEGKVIATGVNPQGVPWKEISFIEEKEKYSNQSKKDQNDKKTSDIKTSDIKTSNDIKK